MMQLLIQNGNTIYEPVVEDGVVWSTERKGVPGKLTFNVIKDDVINFTEGNQVTLRINDKGVFHGFVFTKKRNKDGIISVTAYDQLRYLKNKWTYQYQNKRADEVVKMIADDFLLKTGTLENTGYRISRTEDNETLFDIIQNALDITVMNTKELYVLYDDFGKLTLRNIKNMKVNLLIDEETAETFDYTTSIDEETYNKIVLYYKDEESKNRKFYSVKDEANIKAWGVLQFYDELKEGENGQEKANTLLKLYNQKTRNLTIREVLGDIRVRAGSMVMVRLNLGDVFVNNWMFVEKCKHTFKSQEHRMDLTLRGGEFVG